MDENMKKHLKFIRSMMAFIMGMIFFIGGYMIGHEAITLNIFGMISGVAVIAIGGVLAAIVR
ncbi:MAG: hypothetical protein ACTSPY_13615 [Candidatus Helarchaeota archaeon]